MAKTSGAIPNANMEVSGARIVIIERKEESHHGNEKDIIGRNLRIQTIKKIILSNSKMKTTIFVLVVSQVTFGI